MLKVLLNGRLGNNMFQIAAGASLAKKHNVPVCFYAGDHVTPDKTSLLDFLEQFRSTILRNVTIEPGIPECAEVVKEQQFAYTPIPFVDNSRIEGFFQSEKYFDTDEVKRIFEIDSESRDYILSKYGDLLKEDITAIHVRRGDYFAELDNHPITSLSYFRKAIRHIGKKSRFLIFSNDIAWCKEKFKGSNFFFAENENATIDLYLQSMCTNNIISNSSYSWWAAWLNNNPNKIVICPNPWFGVAKRHYNTSDLIPDGWIQLTNRMPLKYEFLGRYFWYRRRFKYFMKTKFNIVIK